VDLPGVIFPVCPGPRPGEFASFRDDFREPVRKWVEAVANVDVLERAAEHFKPMLSNDEGVDDAIETGSRRGE